MNTGKFKYMPGTIGSIFSYIILLFLYNNFSYIFFIFIFIIIFITSIYLINIYINKSIIKDRGEIVIDEFLGCYTVFIFFPLFKSENFYLLIFYSFMLFRLFDILKPFPINIIDNKMKNSLGIIFDDIIAGIYTIFILVITL